MDFSRSETQAELVDLAQTILADRAALATLKASEQSADGIDRACWKALAEANLLGIAIPEAQGGLGFGFLDLCLVLREIGTHVVPIPVVPCLVSAALPAARFGTPEQQAYLTQVASGESIGTAALSEYDCEADDPHVGATRDGDGWRIDGVKTTVPFADVADRMLVSTRVVGTDQIAMFYVRTDAVGVSMARQTGQNYEHLFEVTFASVRCDAAQLLGSPDSGREILDFTLARTLVAMTALIGGVCDAAVKITAQYTIDRKQFDRQIGTFQAVSQRMADAYINNQAIELTMLQAATHLDEGREVPEEVATAKYWACEGGNQIGHAVLHVHGGISIDLDYPIHRHFLWIKQAEFTLGAATPTLRRLGALLAD
jgi:alkylation response protein AidB-like acyl-CoA dehydrogenase